MPSAPFPHSMILVRASLACLLISALVAPIAAARQAAAPGQLPCALAAKQPLDPADETAIREFVAEHVTGLTDADPLAMSKSREALLSPLSCQGMTFAFRSKYAEVMTPSLLPLAAAKDERQAANALLMMGRLRTTTAADAIANSLKSDNAVIRFAAASGCREVLAQVSKDSFGFPDGAVDRLLDSLASALRVEKNPFAADMLVIALGGATKDNAAFRGRAMLRLTDAFERRLRSLRDEGAADSSWSPTILRCLDLVRQTLFEQGGAGAIDKEFARRAALLGGQTFAYAHDRLAKGVGAADPELSKSVGAADGLTVIAHQAVTGQRRADIGAQAAFDSANAADFAKAVEVWIGPAGLLLKAPYNGKPADFAPAK